jgi:RimJ/RimL family protein N-acetyltransferase
MTHGSHLVLAGDESIRIRELDENEDAPVLALWPHLSRRTRYLRFLSVMGALPDALVRQLVSRHAGRALALVAEQVVGARATVVGLANLAGLDDSSAEVGLVVRDDWQRRQVGTALAQAMMTAAEQRGVFRFIGHVLDENVGMRKLLRRIGVVVSTTTSGNVHELAFVRRT